MKIKIIDLIVITNFIYLFMANKCPYKYNLIRN